MVDAKEIAKLKGEIAQIKKSQAGEAAASSGKNNDSAVAMLCLVALFLTLFIASIFTTNHPIDFVAEALGIFVGYVFLVSFVIVAICMVIYYYNLGYADPEKPFTERAQENLEISREKSSELSTGIRKFYEDYKERKRLAELESDLKSAGHENDSTNNN